MKRTERLFALAEYLRGRRTGVTAEALAERFGVTVRTIYRDLDSLRDASMPLAAERGRGGGYALDRAYSLPPVNFTAREAALLVAIGRFAIDMRLLPFVETLESSLDKVRAALSASAQRELIARLDELSFHGVPALPIHKPVRAALERAWFERQPLRITYVDGDFVQTTRDVRVVAVAMDRHETRLDAADLETGARRHFRLDRIARAVVLDAPPEPARSAAAPRPDRRSLGDRDPRGLRKAKWRTRDGSRR
jgi:predicted DNA-binding transcriptional regulator YafY